MSKLGTVGHRVYQDLLIRSRLGDYRALIESLQARGFRFVTMLEFANIVRDSNATTESLCVIRNDVDSGLRTARAMFEIDRSLGVHTTFYFRLSTWDAPLMRDIAVAGNEAGYHYEEVATFAKRHRIHDRAELERRLPEIRDEFAENLERYKALIGDYPKTLASHGDFVNRRVGLTNACLVNSEVRARFGVVAEGYDDWLVEPLDKRISDASAPQWWLPESPQTALKSNPSSIYILVHPRQWRADRRDNVTLTVQRIVQGARYGLGTRGAR